MQNIITKYLTKNILVVFFAMFFIILFLILGNAFTSVLKTSLNQNLDILSILSLVLIKSFKDIPIIIALTFFLATIVSINKLYKESEIYAMQSAGIGELGILRKTLFLTIVIVAISFYISMFLVPVSSALKDQIIQKNANTSEFQFIKTGEFQNFQDGNIVLYATDNKNEKLNNLFIYQKQEQNKNLILAKEGVRYQDGSNNVYIRLKSGAKYDGFLAGGEKKIIEFDSMDIKIFEQENKNNNINLEIESKSIFQLLEKLDNASIAEMWWRISLPFSLFVLTIIGIFLAKTPPRNTRNLGVLYGVIIFAIYLNLLKSYKDKIALGDELLTSALLPHIIFIILAIILYIKNNGWTRL